MKTIRSLIAQVVAGDTAGLPPLGPVHDVTLSARFWRDVSSSAPRRVPSRRECRSGAAWAFRHASGGRPTAAEIAHFDSNDWHGFHGTGSAELAHSHRVG